MTEVEKDVAAESDRTGTDWLRAQPEPEVATPTYGMCLSCRSVEVALNNVIGTRDFSSIGEYPQYPVGHGCEVCA